MKNSHYIFMIILIQVLSSFGQDNSINFKNEYLPIWESAVKLTEELAIAMPDSLYSYRPTEEVKSFGEQLVHIGHTNQWMYEYFILEKRENIVKEPPIDTSDKDQVLKYLAMMLNQTTNYIKNIPNKDLERKVNFFGEGEIKIKWIFVFMQDHLVNHRGKANLYFRLNGLVPPEYGYLIKLE